MLKNGRCLCLVWLTPLIWREAAITNQFSSWNPEEKNIILEIWDYTEKIWGVCVFGLIDSTHMKGSSNNQPILFLESWGEKIIFWKSGLMLKNMRCLCVVWLTPRIWREGAITNQFSSWNPGAKNNILKLWDYIEKSEVDELVGSTHMKGSSNNQQIFFLESWGETYYFENHGLCWNIWGVCIWFGWLHSYEGKQ
mgnify:CR=1 FL=1